jgi:hypothetical protein
MTMRIGTAIIMIMAVTATIIITTMTRVRFGSVRESFR